MMVVWAPFLWSNDASIIYRNASQSNTDEYCIGILLKAYMEHTHSKYNQPLLVWNIFFIQFYYMNGLTWYNDKYSSKN